MTAFAEQIHVHLADWSADNDMGSSAHAATEPSSYSVLNTVIGHAVTLLLLPAAGTSSHEDAIVFMGRRAFDLVQ